MYQQQQQLPQPTQSTNDDLADAPAPTDVDADLCADLGLTDFEKLILNKYLREYEQTDGGPASAPFSRTTSCCSTDAAAANADADAKDNGCRSDANAVNGMDDVDGARTPLVLSIRHSMRSMTPIQFDDDYANDADDGDEAGTVLEHFPCGAPNEPVQRNGRLYFPSKTQPATDEVSGSLGSCFASTSRPVSPRVAAATAANVDVDSIVGGKQQQQQQHVQQPTAAARPSAKPSPSRRSAMRKSFTIWVGVTSCVWGLLLYLDKSYF